MLSINKFIFLLIGISIVTASGCYYDKAELLYRGKGNINCATVSAKFSIDANPIISSKCATAGCHDAASSAGGAILVNYTQISGLSARIYQRCVVSKTMPTSGPLSSSEIAVLKCWIDSGAPNN